MENVVAGDRHFAGTNSRLLLEHVEACAGPEGVAEVVALAREERPMGVLRDDTTWSSYTQFRRLLEAAGTVLGGVDRLSGVGDSVQVAGGTMPEMASLLQAYGSPDALWRAMGDGGAGLAAVTRGRSEEVGQRDWRIMTALQDGFEPFPELCAFMTGIAPIGVHLFGMVVLSVEHDRCQRRGDEWCSNRVRWAETDDLAEQLAFTTTALDLSRSALEAFQGTVADLVAGEDFDAVLTRIVSTARRATRATGFVLALEPRPWAPRPWYALGVDDDEAEAIAAQLRTGDTDGIGVVLDLASPRQRFGTLAAVDRTGTLMAVERQTLEAYARLASTVLDSTCALVDARRQATTSQALLELSMTLAEVTTAEELAAKVAHVMPDVIDCDRAMVILVNEGQGRVAAHHGFDAKVGRQLDGLSFPFGGRQFGVLQRTVEDAPAWARSFLVMGNMVGMASAPIVIDGEPVGFLVAAVTDHPERLSGDASLTDRFGGLAAQTSVALRNGRLLEHIRHQALHDPLTDLPNRALILDRAEQALVRAERERGPVAALFIDLDGFKEINDTLGHGAGDELLRTVAARLRTVVRSNDTVGRLGGDEFVVLSEGASLDGGAELVAERLLEVLALPITLTGRDTPVAVTASIGIAVGSRGSAGELLRDADIALYSAKDAGKNCFRVFAPEMQAQLVDRAQMAEGLITALANDELFLLYQPIFDLQAEQLTGVEALLRWQHPTRGVIAPDAFIPLLEESGLIVDVGRWVLAEACRQTARWHAAGHPIDVSVNASVRQLERVEFLTHVQEALDVSGLDPASLIIEITETAIMRNAEATTEVLRALKHLGVRIAIDDFGTGYSSLAYLRQFPVDALKIDRSFITSITDSPAAAELIRSLVGLGKALKLETLAEGIEHREQLDQLQEQGCDSGQGFMFARPLTPTALAELLDEGDVTVELDGGVPQAAFAH